MVTTYPMPYGKRSEEPPDRDAGKECQVHDCRSRRTTHRPPAGGGLIRDGGATTSGTPSCASATKPAPAKAGGRYGIDTNPVENAIRPFCLGRRNWLFSDTVPGANASARRYRAFRQEHPEPGA